MSRTLWDWLLGAVDDTARAAIMLVLAGAAMSLAEHRSPLVESPRPKLRDPLEVIGVVGHERTG
jgi:hypothetical protein